MKQRMLAWFLFLSGSAAALISAAKPTLFAGSWPDTLVYFLPALGWMAAGLILLLSESKSRPAGAAANMDTARSLASLIEQLLADTAAFREKLNAQAGKHLLPEIQQLHNRYLYPFSLPETQAAVIAEMGRMRGSQVLSVLAYGERLLNRSSTSLCDGYAREARKSCGHAHAAFREALHLIENDSEAVGKPSG